MAANTTPDSIVYPVSTDQVAPLETVFANLAASVQTALNRRASYDFRWANTAARTAQTGMRTNDIGYQIDTDIEFRFNGTTWILWNQAWRLFSPSFTNLTVGNASTSGGYTVVNGVAHVNALITFGSTTTLAAGGLNLPVLTLPTSAPAIGSSGLFAGNTTVYFLDSGSTYFAGIGIMTGTGVLIGSFTANGSIGAVNPTTPMTWVGGDTIFVSATYKLG